MPAMICDSMGSVDAFPGGMNGGNPHSNTYITTPRLWGVRGRGQRERGEGSERDTHTHT